MTDALLWHRIQFGFTITYHYLFPQLTMGLALIILIFKIRAVAGGDERYNEVARFWARIFGLNFAMGVVTGIPMEFQFGTNWARILPVRRRHHRADAGDGGALRLLPGVGIPGALPLRREEAGPARPPGDGLRPLPRLLALRLLHHRHKRVHAAPGRLHVGAGWQPGAGPLLDVRAEPLGGLAIRTQHDGVGHHGLLRGRRGGGLLDPDGGAPRPRARSACGLA